MLVYRVQFEHVLFDSLGASIPPLADSFYHFQADFDVNLLRNEVYSNSPDIVSNPVPQKATVYRV